LGKQGGKDLKIKGFNKAMSTEEILMAAALSDRKIRELVKEENMIGNYGSLSQIEQQGIDLRTYEIYKYLESGFIGKTERRFPKKEKVEPVGEKYNLKRGVYDIFFFESCKLPKNILALIKTRSSANKNGAWITREFLDEKYTITSGAYDAGFCTDRIAGTLIVFNEYGFATEHGASLAKMLFFESGDVTKTYSKKREKSNHKNAKKEGGETIKNGMQSTFSDF